MLMLLRVKLGRSARKIAGFACAILLIVMVLPSLGASAHAQSNRVLQAPPIVSYVDGVTNDNGEFTLPMANTDFDFAVMTIQDGTNGDWHTMENTKDYNNNFWWNTDSQQFRGWIQAPAYHNQPVRVFTVKGSQLISGVTNDNGEFTLPMANTDFDFAVMTVQDGTNGDWHTMENTKDYNNNFWWNTSSQQFKGWIQAPAYHNQNVRVFALALKVPWVVYLPLIVD